MESTKMPRCWTVRRCEEEVRQQEEVAKHSGEEAKHYEQEAKHYEEEAKNYEEEAKQYEAEARRCRHVSQGRAVAVAVGDTLSPSREATRCDHAKRRRAAAGVVARRCRHATPKYLVLPAQGIAPYYSTMISPVVIQRMHSFNNTSE